MIIFYFLMISRPRGRESSLKLPWKEKCSPFRSPQVYINLCLSKLTHIRSSGLTDLLQPVDSHVGAYVKRLMSGFYKVELEQNYEAWRDYQATGALSEMRRRMLMAGWLDSAWKIVKENPHICEQAFKHTVLIKLDGSHELRYRGLPDYNAPKMMYVFFSSTCPLPMPLFLFFACRESG